MMRPNVARTLRNLRTIGRPTLRTRGVPQPWTARSLIAWAAVLMALAESAWLVYPRARALVLSLEETPAVRGYRLAAGVGCFSFHGPGGERGAEKPRDGGGGGAALRGKTRMSEGKGGADPG